MGRASKVFNLRAARKAANRRRAGSKAKNDAQSPDAAAVLIPSSTQPNQFSSGRVMQSRRASSSRVTKRRSTETPTIQTPKPKARKSAKKPDQVVQNSPLLNLPAEIREMVYHECAKMGDSTVHAPVKLCYKSKAPLNARRDCYGLVHACRQTRAEFFDLYYSNTSFQVRSRHLRLFNAFLSRMSIPSPAVLTINVRCPCSSNCHHLNDYLPVLGFHNKHPTTDIKLVKSVLQYPLPTAAADSEVPRPGAIIGLPQHEIMSISERESLAWTTLTSNRTPAFLSLLTSRDIAALLINGMGRIRMLLRCEVAPMWMKRNPSPLLAETVKYARDLGFPEGITGRDIWPPNRHSVNLEFGIYFG